MCLVKQTSALGDHSSLREFVNWIALYSKGDRKPKSLSDLRAIVNIAHCPHLLDR